MLRIDDVNLELVVEEHLSFEYHVDPKYDDIKDDVQCSLDNGEIEDEDILENVKEFLGYVLTTEDKLQILEFIKDDYDYESCNPEYEVSIFEDDLIKKSINDWIEDKFEFRPDELQ